MKMSINMYVVKLNASCIYVNKILVKYVLLIINVTANDKE